MKIIAFYLPQFHTIPENDRWWGQGFTEWTNTKKAKPLFKGHYQPREPYQDDYYNLLEPSTMRQQAALAKQYGVDGFCYYHYWFDGKKLLEQPLEQMLRDKTVDMPFCLSWANEPWTRAWDGKEREVLMPQTYGTEASWKKHFEYLLPFFSDERYIKIEGKPLFLLYRTSSIPDAEAMVACWNTLAADAGFPGLYIVETLNIFQDHACIEASQAVVEFEPMYTLSRNFPSIFKITDKLLNKLFKKGILTRSYRALWSLILKRKPTIIKGKKTIPGAFVDWDNTARKREKGLVLRGTTPECFERFLSLQLQRAAKEYQSDFLFINAWNEWAEGCYLEPDKKHGKAYLDALQRARKQSNVL